MGLLGGLVDAGKSFLGSDLGQGLLGGAKNFLGGQNYNKLASYASTAANGLGQLEDTICRKRGAEEFQLPSKYQRYLDQGQGLYNQGRAMYGMGQDMYGMGQGMYNNGRGLGNALYQNAYY
jgi:hypothetical protein